MLLRALLLGALLVVPACSKDAGGGSGPAVVAGAQVGTVLELTGKVTATRDGAARELKVGDAVSGDDVIATSAEASVAIELAHNNARWNLGAGKTIKVSESSAWLLAKAAKPAEGVGGDTSAAGRHAERTSADTASTVDRKTEAMPAPPSSDPTVAPTGAPSPGGPSTGSPPTPTPKLDRGGAPPKAPRPSPKTAPPADGAGDLGELLGSSNGDAIGGTGGLRGAGEGGGGVGTSGGIGSIGKGGGTGYGAGASGGKRAPAPGGAKAPENAPSPPPPTTEAPKAPPPPPPPPPPVATTYEQAEKLIQNSVALKACLGTLALTSLAVKCADGTCTVLESKLDAKGKLCAEAAINKLGIIGSLMVKTRVTK